MQTIKCFEVYGNTDTTEGRGPMKIVARFKTRAVAEKYVQSPAYAKWCVMGYQSKDDTTDRIKEVALMILDSCDELAKSELEETKVRALSKLTTVERAALGF